MDFYIYIFTPKFKNFLLEKVQEISKIEVVPALVEGFKDGKVIAYCLVGIDDDGKAIVELRGFEMMIFQNVVNVSHGKLVYISLKVGKGFSSITILDCALGEKDQYYKNLIKDIKNGYKK